MEVWYLQQRCRLLSFNKECESATTTSEKQDYLLITYRIESSLTVNVLTGGDLSVVNHQIDKVGFGGYGGGVPSNAVRDIERCVLLS